MDGKIYDSVVRKWWEENTFFFGEGKPGRESSTQQSLSNILSSNLSLSLSLSPTLRHLGSWNDPAWVLTCLTPPRFQEMPKIYDRKIEMIPSTKWSYRNHHHFCSYRSYFFILLVVVDIWPNRYTIQRDFIFAKSFHPIKKFPIHSTDNKTTSTTNLPTIHLHK